MSRADGIKEREAALAEALEALVGCIPYAGTLGVRYDRLGDELTARLPFSDEIVGNPLLPAIHGGVTGAFLEIAAQLQLGWNEVVAHGLKPAPLTIPKTIDISIDYLRSGRPRETFARAEVQKAGRRVSHVHVIAWQDEKSRPIAMMRGNFLMPEER
ncbi:MAG: PaaI family thioesterase [Pseudomonadota bacterium]